MGNCAESRHARASNGAADRDQRRGWPSSRQAWVDGASTEPLILDQRRIGGRLVVCGTTLQRSPLIRMKEEIPATTTSDATLWLASTELRFGISERSARCRGTWRGVSTEPLIGIGGDSCVSTGLVQHAHSSLPTEPLIGISKTV